jgi:hypothetical protein
MYPNIWEYCNLIGWVIENEDYTKEDGSFYKSPIRFYLKNGFKIFPNIQFTMKNIRDIRLSWRKANED